MTSSLNSSLISLPYRSMKSVLHFTVTPSTVNFSVFPTAMSGNRSLRISKWTNACSIRSVMGSGVMVTHQRLG